MTHGKFAEGYKLIEDMQGSEFLTDLRMPAEYEVMIKKYLTSEKGIKRKILSRLRHCSREQPKGGDEEAISLLAAGVPWNGGFENQSAYAKSSGSFATLAGIHRASSRVSSLAAERPARYA
jgi:hypothetical protein